MPLAPLKRAVQPRMKESFTNRPKYQNFVAHALIQRGGGRGSGPPTLKNHKNIGFLSNTGPDPLKIKKLPSQHSTCGHHRPAPVSKTPFKWRFAGGPMMARFKCYWDSLSHHRKKTKNVRVWQNFLDPRMVAYIDDAHVGPRIVYED